MRILIAAAFPLHRAGGIGTYVRELRSGLEAHGHFVHVFAPHSSLAMKFALDGDVVDADAIRRLVYPVIRQYVRHGLPRQPRSLVEYLEMERYCLEAAALYFGISSFDVIHAQDALTALALARVKSPLTPLITTLHSSMSAEFLIQGRLESTDRAQQTYVQLLEQASVMASDKVIVPSRWLRNLLLQRLQVESERLAVIRSGLDVSTFLSRANESGSLRLPHGRKLIVCAARLDALKGHEHLFDALVKLQRLRTDWVCWLLGDGLLRERLQERVKRLGLRRQVLFAGEQPDVAPYLKAADVVVLSSVQENLPYVVMEAQVVGTPVVATDVGGIPEMITHGDTGLLSSARDSEALCRNINCVLSDPTVARRISGQAQDFANRAWPKERMMSDLLSTYQDALSASREEGQELHRDGPDNQTWTAGNEIRSQTADNEVRPQTGRRHLVRAKDYQSLFSRAFEFESVRVQSSVWDRVMAGAPAGYQIPDSLLNDCLSLTTDIPLQRLPEQHRR
ncbi:glycosyltransferase family 4 protein [Alicyclobacillus sp. ALC3]|uniref:glycosyltransferase family 4 protein n=1 Tax=Alicyclobacillus sp. ALC3 TaxID=2796143 RepID=UPI0023788E4D|nr:glycosyltransferase family 4 protein [Alicyclobacillus sp. ALC3]WDL95165.1 glycosyltransferase family 4 protein [Alicyclobacillus sp. ALC3]